MALRRPWQSEWILITDIVQSKTVRTAILFSDIQQIKADSKLVNGKLKRTFIYTFRDGSTYTLPDEATIDSAPTEYAELIAIISKGIKV